MSKIAIVMGSDSDWPIMEKAADILKSFECPFEAKVLSAHRTPEKMLQFAKDAKKNGFDIIIAGAGGAAHLPGMLASNSVIPVIGVPVKLKSLEGMDSLLSIVQMPKGIPVAAVAIDNATNAALLALRMLAMTDSKIYDQLINYQQKMSKESELKNDKLIY